MAQTVRDAPHQVKLEKRTVFINVYGQSKVGLTSILRCIRDDGQIKTFCDGK